MSLTRTNFEDISLNKIKVKKKLEFLSTIVSSVFEHGKLLTDGLNDNEAKIAKLFNEKYLLWLFVYEYGQYVAYLKYYTKYSEEDSIGFRESISPDFKNPIDFFSYFKKHIDYLYKRIKKLLASNTYNPNNYPNWLSLLYGNKFSDSITYEDFTPQFRFPSEELWSLAYNVYKNSISDRHTNPYFYFSAGTHLLLLPLEMQELLISYGLSVIERDPEGDNHCFAIEVIKRYNLKNCSQVIAKTLSRIEKDIQANSVMDKVSHFDYSYQNNNVYTLVSFNKKTITTIIKRIDQVSMEEKNNLALLFNKTFSDSNDPNKDLNNSFDNELYENKNYKLIEIIYHNKKIIGFNLFELLKFSMNIKNFIAVHILYSTVDPQFRGMRVIPYLSLRIAHGIKKLYPNHMVGTFFNCIHFNSYVPIHQFAHFPKYQSPLKVAVVNKIIDMIYKSNSVIKSHAGTYVLEEKDVVKVVELPAKKENSPSKDERCYPVQRFFNQHILANQKNCGAPIFIEANEDFESQLINMCTLTGFSSTIETSRFSPLLYLMAAKILREQKSQDISSLDILNKSSRL